CFFFQAEDGIRDFHVTGVQTCALPIYRRGLFEGKVGGHGSQPLGGHHHVLGKRAEVGLAVDPITRRVADDAGTYSLYGAREVLRSEERRVGKECGCRWWEYQ